MFMLSRLPLLIMSFLLSTLRDWNVMFEAMALRKPAGTCECMTGDTCAHAGPYARRAGGDLLARPRPCHVPVQLKVASVTDARMTPPTMGSSVSSTGKGGIVPKKNDENMTEKNGSAACGSSSGASSTCPAVQAHARGAPGRQASR